MKTFLSLLIVIFLIGCSPSSTEPSSEENASELDSVAWTQKVFSREEMLSTFIGEDLETFKKSHSPTTLEEAVSYNTEGQLENGMLFSFYVTAEQGKIYELSMDIFPKKEELAGTFSQLLMHYDSLYHPSHPADGYATWRRASANGNLVEITLADVSIEMGRPAIMVNQLEHEGRFYAE